MPQSILEMAKDLVQAQIATGQLPPDNVQGTLQQTYASLMTCKVQEETGVSSAVQTTQTPRESVGWKQSITKYTVTCLECGATFKQLSVRHLRDHELNTRSYRAKHGIPRTQALAAKDTTAMRKKIVQQSKPWEKAPTFMKAQQAKAAAKAPAVKAAKKAKKREAAKA